MLVTFVALERFRTRIPRSMAGGSPPGFLNLPVASPARRKTTDSARRMSNEFFIGARRFAGYVLELAVV